MTLQECKDEVAKKNGFKTFNDYLWRRDITEEVLDEIVKLFESEFNKPPVYGQTAKQILNKHLNIEIGPEKFKQILAAMEEYRALPPSPGSVDVEEKKEGVNAFEYAEFLKTHYKEDGLGDSSGSGKEELRFKLAEYDYEFMDVMGYPGTDYIKLTPRKQNDTTEKG